MFQLLQPIWLFTLAGISIPVIIHLWNQRPGKTLRVGSIALVTENAVSHKKSIRLTEVLLLLLRCLLLSCIAMALAGPLWRSKANEHSKGWVLISRQQLAATYQHYKPLVDSLVHAGFESHFFEEGFAKADFEKAINAAPDTTAVQPAYYRGTIDLLNEQVDPKLPLYVLTDNYLRNFGGYRTPVSLNLHWFTYTPDTISVKPVIDTTALRITIFSGAHTNDARYLKAAADAIQQFSKKNIIVRSVASVEEIPMQQDWLCWLSEEAIPADKKATHILLYAKGKPLPLNSYILPADKSAFDAIPLYSSVIESDSSKDFYAVYWKDGFGHPLLAVEQKANLSYYWLYTHIDPAWNELPWSENFPQLLYELLYGKHGQKALNAVTDKTMIDSSQLMPVLLTEKEAGIKQALFADTKLDSLFWVIAFILFFTERWLSFYHRKTMANG